MTDRVTMTALDTMHMSNVSSENLKEGDVFHVSEADAKRLEDRGLAKRGGSKGDSVNADAVASDRPETREEIDAEREGKAVAAAPANKAQAAAPENKTISAATVSAAPRRASAKKGK